MGLLILVEICSFSFMREDQVTALRGERLGIDHQQLQQFTASSTWAVEPVRRKIAGLAIPLVAPEAWVLDDTGFAKESTASPGVPANTREPLGKTGNCQIAVSLHAATDAASCPLNWRLDTPEPWDDDCAAINKDRCCGAPPTHRDTGDRATLHGMVPGAGNNS